MVGKQVKRSGIESVRAELAVRKVESFRLDALASFSGYTAGDPFAQAVVVTGRPVAEGEDLLEDASVAAIAKALVAMGYRKKPLFAIALSAAAPEAGELERRKASLRPLIELVDPISVIAVDGISSDAVRAAFALPGDARGHVRKLGRSIVLLDDFEAALADETKKREAWHQLKHLALR